MMNWKRWGILALLSVLLLAGGALADTDHSVITLYVVQISSGVLNIREEPTLESPDAGDLYAGDTVVATGYESGWTRIESSVEVASGWVKSEYLTTSTEGYGQYANTSGGNVRIRDGIGGEKTGKVEAGKQVTVSAWGVDADGETWAFIGNGYVMAKYLSKVE